ncbi:MAG TPA: putative 2OG-Fe(II) oxygenase [Allosphingosinicella sp.]|nr:putative 2OG-Fe(II) oxygenase [Allosphingosinicella sp.]
MIWGAPLPDNVASPAAMRALLARAVSASPQNPRLFAKLAHVELDAKDYGAAAIALEAALRLGAEAPELRVLLARSYNYLRRHAEALTILAGDDAPRFERGRALMEMGDDEAAEREFRAVLARNSDDPAACRMLCRLLRRAGRTIDHLSACEQLAERGARNAQFLYNWGWALALAGEEERARRLMFEPERVVQVDLAAPEAFADLASFNAALGADILGNPNRIAHFPEEDEANRGSARIDNLFSGQRAEPVRMLLATIERAVAALTPEARPGFDPWPRLRPASARLRAWGLIQRREAYEEGHIHPGGWLSGVYYLRIPPAVAEARAPGPGCIEFGPPSGLVRAGLAPGPTRAYVPREGMLLLAPSHYQHRTIPSGVDEYRICVAFDVVPMDRPEAGADAIA